MSVAVLSVTVIRACSARFSRSRSIAANAARRIMFIGHSLKSHITPKRN
jgi:hypothetical protein